MSQEIDELKELVRRNTKATEETRQMVEAMRRSQRWHRFFQIVWWLTIVGFTGAVYYYVLAPYIAQVLQLYQSMQSGAQGAQSFQDQIMEFFRQFSATSTQQ